MRLQGSAVFGFARSEAEGRFRCARDLDGVRGSDGLGEEESLAIVERESTPNGNVFVKVSCYGD